jgi:hypothetical protein
MIKSADGVAAEAVAAATAGVKVRVKDRTKVKDRATAKGVARVRAGVKDAGRGRVEVRVIVSKADTSRGSNREASQGSPPGPHRDRIIQRRPTFLQCQRHILTRPTCTLLRRQCR